MSALLMLLQGSLAPQHTETYLQLMTEYIKMVPHPLLAAGGGTTTWLLLQEVLFSLGPAMYWSHRRTLLVIRTIELQTAWLDTICLVGTACLSSTLHTQHISEAYTVTFSCSTFRHASCVMATNTVLSVFACEPLQTRGVSPSLDS